jgi:hypothetical protein
MIKRIKEFLLAGSDYHDRVEEAKEDSLRKAFRFGYFQ